MKKVNNKGFSALEVILILVIVGLIGGIGFRAFRNQAKNNPKNGTDLPQQSQQADEKKTTVYEFKELGISMDLLEGWEVRTGHTQEEGANYYKWTVSKADGDGRIELTSSAFQGGFYGCKEMGDPLTKVTIKDVAPTKNPKLLFLSWSYSSTEGEYTETEIVMADDKSFVTSNDNAKEPIVNSELKPGTYFYCSSSSYPGLDLGLSNEKSRPNTSRIDGIGAFTNPDPPIGKRPLGQNSQSYKDVKTMLTSIK